MFLKNNFTKLRIGIILYFIYIYVCILPYYESERRKKVKQKGQYQGRTVWGEVASHVLDLWKFLYFFLFHNFIYLF